MNYKISRIAEIIGGESRIANDDEIKILLTDSRSLSFPASTLFFAIPTKGNDGHRYIKLLRDQGVRNFVVNHIPETMHDATDCNFIITESTTDALSKLACDRRRNFRGTTIAITGSRGKTALKEWIFQLLEPDFNIVRSPRSYNSQIGVPLSLWEIDNSTELAIIEAGISQTGEMERLQAMILPDIAIITNIGKEHDEGFQSRQEKAEEKILLTKDAKTVIYPADDELLDSVIRKHIPAERLMSYSMKDPAASLFISKIEKINDSEIEIEWNFSGRKGTFRITCNNDYNIENACMAFAAAIATGCNPDNICSRMESLTEIGTRLNVTEGVNNCSIIYDTYTSDFSSLWTALDFMSRRMTPELTPTMILSDLRHESLPDSELYPSIASLCHKAGIKRFIGIGPNLCAHAGNFDENALFFDSTDSFMEHLSTSDFSSELILIKGAPEYDFGRIAENLEARTHETVLEVNLDSIVSNFNYFRRHLPASTGLIAMVKASGYGAGSLEIAKTLQAQGAAYLAVAVIDEGIDLRKAGITMPIMVMNPKVVNYKSMFAYNLEPEIYSMEMLDDVVREARKNGIKHYPIHLKIDTGMHRMGFEEKYLDKVIERLNGTDAIYVASVFSHLATADCPDMKDYTLQQLECFARATRLLGERLNYPFKRHILNTAGILRHTDHAYDMARLGIGLYGVNPFPEERDTLSVVSTLRTVVIAIQEREAGDSIGYARKGMLTRPSRIATIPIGYADGMNRKFGCGRSRVYINGHYAPTVGNICMDACMIDVTDIPCKLGDAVEIFGSHVRVEDLAEILDTIPYEVLTSVSPRVKRVYYRE